MGYKSNRNVVYSCKYHVVFCPKFRRPVLADGVDLRLKEILADVAVETRSELHNVEVMPAHLHVLVEVDPRSGIRKFVKPLTGRSSRLLRQEFPHMRSRLPTLWTNSYFDNYFVSTVGGPPSSAVRQYRRPEAGLIRGRCPQSQVPARTKSAREPAGPS
jgi:putative transposase